MKVKRRIVTIEEIELNIIEITLLSRKEYRKYEDLIPLMAHHCWWLRSPGISSSRAGCVLEDGSLGHCGVEYFLVGARPALRIENLKSSKLNPGDKFEFAELEWTVLSNELALCDNSIGWTCFQHDCEAYNANDYNTSDVKKYIDDWAKKKGIM